MILHHIQHSASEDNALGTCLRYAASKDSILLSGNGLYSLLLPAWQVQLTGYSLYLLKEDVMARGLSSRLSAFKMIDYDEFISQTLTHEKVITW
ncbi:sulfurtransferase complex subunit TusB [Shewanella surugensis]|uniref:Sulfurtransferase complex subunit TusB n=1 Tax=Shewanella surugensis TaxID=212020 RepID=A0ABT0L9P7_9GAMM|nr:sulfurtransferase complex subunit TusB [Shewanella surugensis]MCL1124443.1 sulfurtransferase complex subunit TusB [Shewanella surugensis]